MKLNNAETYEPIVVYLSKKTPIAWGNRVKSLMKSGLSKKDAEKEATGEIELELYYNEDAGLFAVETEAVESGSIFDPYSGEELETDEDED